MEDPNCLKKNSTLHKNFKNTLTQKKERKKRETEREREGERKRDSSKKKSRYTIIQYISLQGLEVMHNISTNICIVYI